MSFSTLDSAPYVPKSVVVDNGDFDWEGDVPPQVDPAKTVFYELHVKGYTKLHPKVQDAKRGTFRAGKQECLRVSEMAGRNVGGTDACQCFYGGTQCRFERQFLGYETLNFFALEPSYMVSADINNFKKMVKRFHESGLEVILDMVYNHTLEGNHLGPTLCYRGIDNESVLYARRN